MHMQSLSILRTLENSPVWHKTRTVEGTKFKDPSGSVLNSEASSFVVVGVLVVEGRPIACTLPFISRAGPSAPPLSAGGCSMSRGPYRGNFARPENALKRADELENVGQKLSALQQLHDVVTSKKHRTWSKTYEEIMFKLLDLCVEMQKRNQAKEALMQYRNMCQQVNINSLEEVIKYYLNKATEKAEEARQQAEVSSFEFVATIRP